MNSPCGEILLEEFQQCILPGPRILSWINPKAEPYCYSICFDPWIEAQLRDPVNQMILNILLGEE